MTQPQHHLRRCIIAVLLAATLVSAATAHATIYVLVLDSREIAIATDAIWITTSPDGVVQQHGVREKLVRLGPRLGIMCAGLTQLTTTKQTIDLSAIAVEISRRDGNKGGQSMAAFSHEFGRIVNERFNALSPEAKAQTIESARRINGNESGMLECIFAGVDFDNKLKTETVDIFSTPASMGFTSFAFNVDEAIGQESPRLMLSGDIEVLRNALEKGLCPIGRLPSFRRWLRIFQTRHVDPEKTAEALVDLVITWSPASKRRMNGYPIYVYRIDVAGGLQKLRTVPRGHAVSLSAAC